MRAARVLLPALLVLGIVAVPGSPVAAQAFRGEIRAVDFSHPAPRADVTAAGVLAAERALADPAPEVVEAYRLAAEIPRVLDGINAVCHEGRSLLSCFESDAGVRCAYCRTVVREVHAMHRRGIDLKAIRGAVDAGSISPEPDTGGRRR